MRAVLTRSLLACVLASFAQHVLADEGGVPFWFSGAYASLAAVPATPGWSLPAQGYFYSGDASASKSFHRGDSISTGLKSRSPLVIVQPTYSPETKILDGQTSFGLGMGYGRNMTKVDVSVSPRGTEWDRSDATNGSLDLYPIASIAWNEGVHNTMAYVTGDIPVGAYDSKRLANLGIGHAAMDLGGGYTYFNEQTGREFSAVLGATYNWENADTNYKNGVDSHLDWAASQFLSANWQLGIAGYVYYQLTGDSGSGAHLGSFKSKVAAVGPEVGYVFNMKGQQAYANLRSYYEFWSENRVQGYAVFATVSLPLGK
jgi:hypothetical protein